MNAVINLSPKKVALALSIVVICLTTLGLFTQYQASVSSENWANNDFLVGIQKVFNLGIESNLPSWYKSSSLLVCSYLLFVIAAHKRSIDPVTGRYWRDLGIIFLVFSMDEIASFHKGIGYYLSNQFETEGIFLYAWVIVGAVFVVLFGVVYLRFLGGLPLMPRYLFTFSGFLYVIGAIGLKMFEGWYIEWYGRGDRVLIVITACRQFLEMIAVVVFIYALLSFIKHNVETELIRIE